jgi:hypothetical protein
MFRLIFALPLAIPVLLILAGVSFCWVEAAGRKQAALLALLPAPFAICWALSRIFQVQPGSPDGAPHSLWANTVANGLVLGALILPAAIMIAARPLWLVTLCIGLAVLIATVPAGFIMVMSVTGLYL